MKPKAKRAPRKTKSWIRPDTRRRIEREAKTLGISPQEYLQLLTALGVNLRESLPDDSREETVACLRAMNHPLVGMVLRWVGQSVTSSIQGGQLDVNAFVKQWLPSVKSDTPPKPSIPPHNTQPDHGPPAQIPMQPPMARPPFPPQSEHPFLGWY